VKRRCENCRCTDWDGKCSKKESLMDWCETNGMELDQIGKSVDCPEFEPNLW